MNKAITMFNIAGFHAFLFLYGIAFRLGKKAYKYILTPVCWVLWQAAKRMPD